MDDGAHEHAAGAGLQRARCLQLPRRGLLARLRRHEAPPGLVWVAGDLPDAGPIVALHAPADPIPEDALSWSRLARAARRSGLAAVAIDPSTAGGSLAVRSCLAAGVPVLGVVRDGIVAGTSTRQGVLESDVLAGGGAIVGTARPGTDGDDASSHDRDLLLGTLPDAAIILRAGDDGAADPAARMLEAAGGLVVTLDEGVRRTLPGAIVARTEPAAMTACRVAARLP